MAATILCVDVDRQLFQILEKAFRNEGFRAIPAYDGESALALVKQEAPEMVLLDITIPKRDGFEVLEEIRTLPGASGQVPVLLTCGGRITPKYEERAREAGAQGLLAKPVPLQELLSRVREHVKSSPAELKSARRADGPKVEGDLQEIDFSHLLHHLHGLRATGVLMISNAKKKKAIQMRDGHPVAVKSNLVNECLGNYLVRNGKLSRETVDESLARMKKGEGLQGQILVAMEVITEEEIAAALREHARDKLFEIFEWRRGAFNLRIGSRLNRGNTLALDTSPANIILEGVRRRTSSARIDEFHARHGKCYVRPGQSPFYRFQEVDLDAAEEALLASLDGTCSLVDLCSGDDGMRRTLYGLLATELLELRSGPEGDSSVVPAKTPVIRPAEVVRATDGDPDRQHRVELAAMAKSLRGKNYFEMLGVSERVSDDEVEQAYQQLARRAHPDRFNSASVSVQELAAEVFKLVEAAYETLSDSTRRSAYREAQRRGANDAAKEAKDQRAIVAEVEFQHGETFLRQRDYERALAHFAKAREAAPRDGQYLAHYGWCLHLCNPDNATVIQEAIAHVKRAAALARDQEKTYLFLGRLCKVVGDTAVAEEMFTRAVQIKPDCLEAMRELRLINLRRGKGLIGRLLRR